MAMIPLVVVAVAEVREWAAAEWAKGVRAKIVLHSNNGKISR
jgi:hypothetical protein